jgi:hypothetical protein
LSGTAAAKRKRYESRELDWFLPRGI